MTDPSLAEASDAGHGQRDAPTDPPLAERTRSEYRLHLAAPSGTPAPTLPESLAVRGVARSDREAVAALLLDAYRGTIDDEGEGDAEALAAIDDSFAILEWAHSIVLHDEQGLVALSFVVVVDGRAYIDPVATMASHKRQGIGRAAVRASLHSLANAGVTEVGATITDGNTASERLFVRLGFVRVGPWP